MFTVILVFHYQIFLLLQKIHFFLRINQQNSVNKSAKIIFKGEQKIMQTKNINVLCLASTRYICFTWKIYKLCNYFLISTVPFLCNPEVKNWVSFVISALIIIPSMHIKKTTNTDYKISTVLHNNKMIMSFFLFSPCHKQRYHSFLAKQNLFIFLINITHIQYLNHLSNNLFISLL